MCNCITGILWALAGYVANFCEGAEIRMQPGDVRIAACGDVAAAFEMALIGLRQLERAYPDCLEVEVRTDTTPKRTT